MNPPTGPEPPDIVRELEEKFRKDRERLGRDFDPYLQDGFNIYKVNPRRQEAYDKCAPEVVKFLKCVDQEGPAWFWRCNALHIELQRCYNAAKPESTSIITVYMQDWKDTALTRWEQLKGLYRDVTGSKEDRDD